MEFPISLKIKNFKKIKGPLKLVDIDSVNYLVGKNGSGKTSILKAIEALDNNGQASQSMSEDGFVKMTYDDINKTIKYTALNRTFHIEGDGGMITNVHVFSSDQFDYKLDTQLLNFLNETNKNLGEQNIEAKKIMTEDPFDRSDSETVFFQEGIKILPALIADGIKAMNALFFFLSKTITLINSTKGGNAHLHIGIIEEPENNLHPEFQKLLPGILNATLGKLIPACRNRFAFFVSTHSPFIISQAAQYGDQKIYLLDRGHLLDLKGAQVKTSRGHAGATSAKVVGEMLGASVTDLGYPTNYVILEEYSLQLLLQSLQEKRLIKPVQFISCSGANKVEDMIKSLENYNTLLKCNPFYSDNYLVIIDSVQSHNKETQTRIAKIKDRLGKRFIELKNNCLENYYKNLDVNIYQAFANDIRYVVDWREKGIIKSKYAGLIANLITNKADFSRLFNNELDILLH